MYILNNLIGFIIRQKQNKVSTKPDNNKLLSIELKPEARRLYIEKTGNDVKPLCLQDKRNPWLIASIDGVSDDFKKIVEIDCDELTYSQAKKGSVSDCYSKLQHQLMITGLEVIDYWCYKSAKENILQTVERDDEHIKKLFKAEQEFVDKLNL